MKKMIFAITGLLALLVITACTPSNSSPKIELNTYSFDLGDIDPDMGNRIETFTVKNTGLELLKITDISTSCGCTEAEVDSKEILPGESTKLTVTYDPSVHPGLTGKIKRIVYIKSNDPSNKEVELELTGNSLSSKEGHHDELEEFEISPTDVNSKISDNGGFKLLDVREDFEYEENHLKDALLLSVNELTQEELDKLGLKKEDEIVVYCRSGRRSATAYQTLTELGYTNVKSMAGGIVHWMEEGFPVESGPPQQEAVPSISFDKGEYDFGEIRQFGGVVNTSFILKNNGDFDLLIRSLSTSCACTTAEIESELLKPGQQTKLNVFFDPDFHEEPAGRFSRTIFIETNDPNNPEAEVKIFVDILEGQ